MWCPRRFGRRLKYGRRPDYRACLILLKLFGKPAANVLSGPIRTRFMTNKLTPFAATWSSLVLRVPAPILPRASVSFLELPTRLGGGGKISPRQHSSPIWPRSSTSYCRSCSSRRSPMPPPVSSTPLSSPVTLASLKSQRSAAHRGLRLSASPFSRSQRERSSTRKI